jgi:hypothetical protein
MDDGMRCSEPWSQRIVLDDIGLRRAFPGDHRHQANMGRRPDGRWWNVTVSAGGVSEANPLWQKPLRLRRSAITGPSISRRRFAC